MARATESTSHGNRHSVVSSVSDLSLVVKILVEDTVFKYQPGRGTKEIEFIDLYVRGTKVIAAGTPLDKYQQRARGNWKLKLAINGEQSDDNRDDDSTIGALEGAGLSSTVETDEDDNDDE